MGQPSKPVFQKEGPASPCILHGVNLSWDNCTVLSAAMGIDKSTLGRVRISGCQVRDETGDYSGGTTIPQVQEVCTAHGVATDAHVGGNVASLYYLAYQNALGRGFVLQGNTQPDGRGNVNHAVWVNDCYGGTPGNPTSFDVYDPWSNGPATWSYAKLKAFMLALHPYGEKDPRTLKNMGVNGGYALVFPDTEPHFHSHYGGLRQSPFPQTLHAHPLTAGHRVNMRTGPGLKYGFVTVNGKQVTLAAGTPWNDFQYVHANPIPGFGDLWYGNHDGNRWIHSSGLK